MKRFVVAAALSVLSVAPLLAQTPVPRPAGQRPPGPSGIRGL